MKKTIAIILSIMLVLAVTLPAVAISTIAVKSIKLDNSNITLKVGQTSNLKVTFTPANTTQMKLTYVTGNKNVATVSSTGVIKGVHAGNTAITVYTINKKVFAKCNLTILTRVDISKFVTVDSVMLGSKPTNGQVDKMMVKANAILKREINANLKFTWIEWADWLTKYNLLLASGEPLDLITSGDWLELWQNAQKGPFLALDELLPQYAPKLWAEIPQSDWEQCKLNGKIVVLPENNYTQWVNHGIFVRGDWLKEFGMSKVKDFNTLGTYFQNIIDKKPGIIPFDTNGTMGTLFPGWVQSNTDELALEMLTTGFLPLFFAKSYDEKYTITSPVFEKTFVDFAKKMKEFGDKKYWREDVLNNKADMYSELQAGKTGAASHHSSYYKGLRVVMDEKQPGSDLQMFAFSDTRNNLLKTTITLGATTIGVNSKNPGRALMVYEMIRENQELYRLINYGIEGVQYIIKNGNIVKPEGYDETRDGCYTDFWGGREDKFELPTDSSWPGISEIWKGYAKIAHSTPYGRFIPNRTPVEAELAALSDVVSQLGPAICYGKAGDPTKAVEELRAKLKTVGFDKAQAEFQKQMDAYKKLVENK